MFGQHMHYRFPRKSVEGLVPWWGNRYDVDPDGGDGGTGGSGGGGSVKMAPPMTQASFDAIVRDAKAQAKRSAVAEITEKYGDLEALKTAAAEGEDDPEIAKGLDALFNILVPDAPDGTGIKDLLAKANTRVTEMAKVEAEKADADALTVRQEALKTAGIDPKMASVLNLQGTTAEDLATEIADKKLVETLGGVTPAPKPPVGGGTNPADAGAPAPAGLTEAIGDHYANAK